MLIYALDKNDLGFKQLRERFPKFSEAKVKEDIFVEPQIGKLLKDPTFYAKLTNLELGTWMSFRDIVHGFFFFLVTKKTMGMILFRLVYCTIQEYGM